MGIYETMQKKLLYDYTSKKMIMRLLRSPYIVNNPLYGYVYEKRVKKVMKEGENAPLHVAIENTNACNSNCIMCTHDKMTRKVGFMDMDIFKKIVDKCVELGVGCISIQGFGEPLLDPLFIKRIKYAKVSGINKVITNTNASLLNEKMAREILDSGLDEMYISFDAVTKETYEKIRRGLKFEVTESNIFQCLKLKKEMGKKKLVIILDYLQLPENEFETKGFIKKWKNLVENICISSAHNWAGGSESKSVNGFHSRFHKIKRQPCRLLWTDLVIYWNGDVPLCCQDYDGKIILGNVKQKSIKDIWNEEKLKNIRQLHVNGEFRKISLCEKCLWYPVWW